MYYSELLNFESLESVIELRQADDQNTAKQLVSTFVFSDELTDRLINLVFVQLQFYPPSDNKGLFIVGNYGTGKSHLMAVLSSLAENAELIKYIQYPKIAAHAPSFAGHFYVLRTEIGATTRSLRNIITQELENYLATLGISFQFPPADAITNNKTALMAMMATFAQSYPDFGLLLVVDELLEYLRTRKDQEFLLDLNFLRELGEICKNTRFRFIAGIQETIFDNPRFNFVADSLRRVKDRFEQLLITRNDIKFVVAERLLKKNPAQLQKIQQYLSRFAVCYSHLAQRLDEFSRLFPVHPDYIDTFERITVIEKREILKTIERECQAKLPQLVPEHSLELIAYDSYWNTLRQNPSFRSLPAIREVIECSQVLQHRIEQAFTLPPYQPLALRIIQGLSVHRLTTHDIYAPVGVTAQELLDSLCLYQPGVEDLGGRPADDLLMVVETTLTEILKTLNRQFISTNPTNGQYYLDVKKNYDFDALIEQRADSLDFYQLNRSYYEVLQQLLEVTAQPAVVNTTTGNWVWEYELEWRTHRVTRLGLLIFGTPQPGPTILPSSPLPEEGKGFLNSSSRDFYLYFLPLYESPLEIDEKSTHTLFFRFTGQANKFEHWLRLHAATTDLMAISAESSKTIYHTKRQHFLQHLLEWFQQNLPLALQVTYQDRSETLFNWLKTRLRAESGNPEAVLNFRDNIELIANICLERHFTEMAPAYPIFPILVSHDNLTTLAQQAVRQLNHSKRSQLAQGLLDGLELLENDQINPQHSKYARAILDLLSQRPEGQVLTRSQLLQEDQQRSYFAPDTYHLEPELLIVLLVALVSSKDIILTLGGQTFDASQIEALVNLPLSDLLYFRHIDRPKNFNLIALTALFELLDLPVGTTSALAQNDEQVVRQLQSKLRDKIHQLLQAYHLLLAGVHCWEKPLFTPTELQHYQNLLSHTKNFLESLQIFTAAAKFKNFRYSVEEINQHQQTFSVLPELNHLQTILLELTPAMTYLTTAATVLPAEHPWQDALTRLRDSLCLQLAQARPLQSATLSYQLKQPLITLQQDYAKAYLKLHQQARLGVMEDKEKTRLTNDYRLLNLTQLAKIDLLPSQAVAEFETQLQQLQTCYELSEYDLNTHTICPHCGFQPRPEISLLPALTRLAQMNKTLRLLHTDWTQILLNELTQANIPQELLKPEARRMLEQFLTRRTLPEQVTTEFIEMIQESLTGLVKIVVKLPTLRAILSAGGAPLTVAEIQQRFNDYLHTLTQGQPLSKIRIVVEI